MNEQIEALLELNGWTVECQSPLEIRHTDGSFASGQVANLVIDSVQDTTSAL